MEAATTRATRLAILDAAAAVGKVFAGTELRLFVNEISVSEDLKLADLVEASFDGYSPVTAVALGTAFFGPDGSATLTAPSVDFVMTGVTTLETVYGWFLVNTAGSALVAAGSLDSPVPLTEVSQGLTVQPQVKYGE